MKSGEVYVFQINASLPDRTQIKPGDRIRLIEPTGLAPWGYMDTKTGHNWLCEAPNGISVWSTIAWAVERGYLKLCE